MAPPPTGDVPLLAVEYAADGEAVVKTSIGVPVHATSLKHLNGGRPALDGVSGHAVQRGSGGPGVATGLALPGGRNLPLLLLLSCFMAALAAVAGTGASLTRVLDLPWLS